MGATIRPLLTAQEVAAIFGVSVRTIRIWSRSGKLNTVKVGREFRFRRADLQRVLSAGKDAVGVATVVHPLSP